MVVKVIRRAHTLETRSQYDGAAAVAAASDDQDENNDDEQPVIVGRRCRHARSKSSSDPQKQFCSDGRVTIPICSLLSIKFARVKNGMSYLLN